MSYANIHSTSMPALIRNLFTLGFTILDEPTPPPEEQKLEMNVVIEPLRLELFFSQPAPPSQCD